MDSAALLTPARTRDAGNPLAVLPRLAAARGDAPALGDGETTLGFATLADTVARWAARLREQGLNPGDVLAVALRDDLGHVLLRLAAAHAGVAVLPVDWRLPATERDRLLARWAVARVALPAGVAPPAGANFFVVDEAWQAAARAAEPLAVVHGPLLPVVLNLSSGTTGEPTAAVVTQAQYAERIANNVATFGSFADAHYLSATPLCFSGGMHFCLTTLLQGGRVTLYPPLFDAAEYVDAVRAAGADLVFVVPTLLRWLLALPGDGGPLLPGVRWFIVSAAATSPDEKLALRERVCPRAWDLYAAAAAGQIAVLAPTAEGARLGTVGRGFGSTELGIGGEAGEPLPPGTAGRIRVRGPAVSAVQAGGLPCTDVDGWYYPGDLGVLDADGWLTVLGRGDDVFQRGGINLYPAAIEAALRRHAAVADVAVVGRPHPVDGAEPVAYVSTRAAVTAAELLAHCRAHLAAYQLPAVIEFVTNFPRTTSGKILRRALR